MEALASLNLQSMKATYELLTEQLLFFAFISYLSAYLAADVYCEGDIPFTI